MPESMHLPIKSHDTLHPILKLKSERCHTSFLHINMFPSGTRFSVSALVRLAEAGSTSLSWSIDQQRGMEPYSQKRIANTLQLPVRESTVEIRARSTSKGAHV